VLHRGHRERYAARAALGAQELNRSIHSRRARDQFPSPFWLGGRPPTGQGGRQGLVGDAETLDDELTLDHGLANELLVFAGSEILSRYGVTLPRAGHYKFSGGWGRFDSERKAHAAVSEIESQDGDSIGADVGYDSGIPGSRATLIAASGLPGGTAAGASSKQNGPAVAEGPAGP